nr:hypothetical protein [Tanacetum cinerariifolium]
MGLEYYHELLRMPRSSSTSLLHQLKEQGGIDIICVLLLAIQQTQQEYKVLAASLLLQLDILEESVDNILNREVAIKTLLESLTCEENPDAQQLSAFILSNLGGTYAWSGESYTIASSSTSLLHQLNEQGGIDIICVLLLAIQQTQPEYKVLAASLLLQLDVLEESVDNILNREVAIKTLLESLTCEENPDAQQLAAFILSVKKTGLNSMLHKNIVKNIDWLDDTLQGLKSKNKRVSRYCLTTIAWIGCEIVKGPDDLRCLACDILLSTIEQYGKCYGYGSLQKSFHHKPRDFEWNPWVQGPPTPTRSITTALSSTAPPPKFATGGTSCGASSSSALTPSKRKVNCPICGRNMHNEKAFCGHIRWHTQEERDAKSGEIQETLALSRQVEDAVEIAKKIKIPDLNKLPQPEDDDDAADA